MPYVPRLYQPGSPRQGHPGAFSNAGWCQVGDRRSAEGRCRPSSICACRSGKTGPSVDPIAATRTGAHRHPQLSCRFWPSLDRQHLAAKFQPCALALPKLVASCWGQSGFGACSVADSQRSRELRHNGGIWEAVAGVGREEFPHCPRSNDITLGRSDADRQRGWQEWHTYEGRLAKKVSLWGVIHASRCVLGAKFEIELTVGRHRPDPAMPRHLTKPSKTGSANIAGWGKVCCVQNRSSVGIASRPSLHRSRSS
jgi:hypothetical protein